MEREEIHFSLFTFHSSLILINTHYNFYLDIHNSEKGTTFLAI